MPVEDLATLHLDTLYEYDAAGLIAGIPGVITTPRVHLLRTPDGNHWRLGAGCSPALRERLAAALAAEPVVVDPANLENRPPALDALRSLLATEAPPANEYRGPAFAFPEHIPEPARTGDVEVVGDATGLRAAGRLAWISEVTPAERPLVIARDANGVIVAFCHSARASDRAAAAGVETAEDARRAGYGIATVAAWARAVRAEGRVPLYSTWWGNTASRALARRLGLVCYGEDTHID